MIGPRSSVIPALGAVAALFFAIALVMRPHGLPRGSAEFAPASVPLKDAASRPATLGLTYGIDTIEVNGTRQPLPLTTPIHATGSLIVRGWAVIPATLSPGTHLWMSLDRAAPAAVTSYGTPRPDVGTAVNPSAVNSGFAASVPVAGLRLGDHVIVFRIADARGHSTELPTPVSFTLQ